MRHHIIFLLFLLLGCGSSNQIHTYMIVKSISEDILVSKWRPVVRVTYRFERDVVISEVASLVDEYHDCEINDINNWRCDYIDGLGQNSFGFVRGKYWKSPSLEDAKYVTRTEYNLIRCKWFIHNEGLFSGIVSCLKTYV